MHYFIWVALHADTAQFPVTLYILRLSIIISYIDMWCRHSKECLFIRVYKSVLIRPMKSQVKERLVGRSGRRCLVAAHGSSTARISNFSTIRPPQSETPAGKIIPRHNAYSRIRCVSTVEQQTWHHITKVGRNYGARRFELSSEFRYSYGPSDSPHFWFHLMGQFITKNISKKHINIEKHNSSFSYLKKLWHETLPTFSSSVPVSRCYL